MRFIYLNKHNKKSITPINVNAMENEHLIFKNHEQLFCFTKPHIESSSTSAQFPLHGKFPQHWRW